MKKSVLSLSMHLKVQICLSEKKSVERGSRADQCYRAFIDKIFQSSKLYKMHFKRKKEELNSIWLKAVCVCLISLHAPTTTLFLFFILSSHQTFMQTFSVYPMESFKSLNNCFTCTVFQYVNSHCCNKSILLREITIPRHQLCMSGF